jgi:hypothetical protein
VVYIYIYIILFNIFLKNNVKKYVLVCLFMSMLYTKIKFEIDINNDELLKIIWKHMREIKRGEGDIIKLMNLHLFHHYSLFIILVTMISSELV